MAEIINGYELTAPFQNQNAGFSRWTFARKNGREYFIKEFLSPKYPNGSELSPSLKNEMIEICNTFYGNKSKIYNEINRVSDGNLLKINDFFTFGAYFYIVTDKIENEKISIIDVARLPWDERLLLCKVISHSLMMLEQAHIVHADIKADNILLKRTSMGKIVAKIIDYDCSFFESYPPQNEDDLGCDQVYVSPEALDFIFGEPAKLTVKMDTFALGILFHEYLTGRQPNYDKSQYDCAAEALLNGSSLDLDSSLPEDIEQMLYGMLECDPDKRLYMSQIYEVLNSITRRKQFAQENNAIQSNNNYEMTIKLESSDIGGANVEANYMRMYEWFRRAGDVGASQNRNVNADNKSFNVNSDISSSIKIQNVTFNYNIGCRLTHCLEIKKNSQLVCRGGISLNMKNRLVYFGRKSDNDVVIDDSTVSRRHFVLEYDYSTGDTVLSDLGSTNGTFLNDLRVYGRNIIRMNDVIKAGKYEIIIFGYYSN